MTSYKTLYQEVIQLLQSDPDKEKNILTKIQNNIFWIIFNRPKRYNAFSNDMYIYYKQLIQVANQMENIKFIVVTGNGGNFSSGNDLSNFTDPKYEAFSQRRKQLIQVSARVLQQLTDAIIDSKKPIYGLIEGKAIGVGFTQLALFDRVFAADNAQYIAPLVRTAQGPQMCSSYLFPKIFGQKVGQELIMEAKIVNSAFLANYNFVKRFANLQVARKALMNYIQQLNQLEWESFMAARELFKVNERKILKHVNDIECKNLVNRWNNPNLIPYLMEYMQKKKQNSKPKL